MFGGPFVGAVLERGTERLIGLPVSGLGADALCALIPARLGQQVVLPAIRKRLGQATETRGDAMTVLLSAAQIAVGITIMVAGILTLAVHVDRSTGLPIRWPMGDGGVGLVLSLGEQRVASSNPPPRPTTTSTSPQGLVRSWPAGRPL